VRGDHEEEEGDEADEVDDSPDLEGRGARGGDVVLGVEREHHDLTDDDEDTGGDPEGTGEPGEG
jgi:hypothetical protein